MTPPTARQIQHAADDYGRRLSQRLDDAAGDLPYDFSERLRAARMQAVAARRQPQRAVAAAAAAAGGRAGAALVFGGGNGNNGWGRGPVWQALASALPVLALVVGLILVNDVLNDERAREVAEVDAALLTDALPPAAYSDAGFLEFLKSGAPAADTDADTADGETADGESRVDVDGDPAAVGATEDEAANASVAADSQGGTTTATSPAR